MSARAIALAGLFWTALSFSGILRAETIHIDPSDFAVYAGGSLGADQSVRIDGNIGSQGDTWLARDVMIGGAAYTGETFGADRNVTVTGRIVAGRDVSIDRESVVGAIDSARDVWLGTSAVSQSISATRNVSLSSGVGVGGSVSYGNSYWASSSANVSGPVSQGASPVNWSTIARTTPAFTHAAGSQWYAQSSDFALDPGTYGSLSVDKESTLRLTAGVYNFNNLWIDRETHIIADTTGGAVMINLAGSLSTGREVVFETIGDGTMTFQTGGDIYLGREAQIEANLVAFGHVNVDAFSRINGGMYAAGNVWLDQGVNVSGGFGGSGGNAGAPTDVPEPASLTTALVGLALIARRPRRKA